MTIHCVTIGFFGRARGAAFEAATKAAAHDLARAACAGIVDAGIRSELCSMIDESAAYNPGYNLTRCSRERGALSVNWGMESHDQFLDLAILQLAPLDGLDYSDSVVGAAVSVAPIASASGAAYRVERWSLASVERWLVLPVGDCIAVDSFRSAVDATAACERLNLEAAAGLARA